MTQKAEKLSKGDIVTPACDRCRRLRLPCVKHLTACQGCTKKHAKCSWKAMTADEAAQLRQEMGMPAESEQMVGVSTDGDFGVTGSLFGRGCEDEIAVSGPAEMESKRQSRGDFGNISTCSPKQRQLSSGSKLMARDETPRTTGPSHCQATGTLPAATSEAESVGAPEGRPRSDNVATSDLDFSLSTAEPEYSFGGILNPASR